MEAHSENPSAMKHRIIPVFLVAFLCTVAGMSAYAQEGVETQSLPPQPVRGEGMAIWEAAVLGVVEGLTEYLPVSSTGHLILVQRLMGIGGIGTDSEAADAYAIVIQAGAILAVLGVYFAFVRRIGNGVLGNDPEGLRLLSNLLVAFIPAALLGLTLHQEIKDLLFGMRPVTIAWFVGGIAILAISRWREEHKDLPGEEMMDMHWYSALLIGFIQCAAVWPGTSRSLVTIVGGVLIGLNLRSAVIFSFLLGAVTLSASTAYDALTHGQLMVDSYGMPAILTGFLTAFLSAMVAVKWMVNYLKRHGLALFGYYRVILAFVVAMLMASGVLPAD